MKKLGAFLLAALLLAGCSSSLPEGEFRDVEGIKVLGTFGDEPSLAFSGKSSDELRRSVLSEGSGPEVQEGDLVVLDYFGQVFDGDVFDSSFKSANTLAFPLGNGGVIPGIERTVEGVKVGSRVVVSVPPSEGYGDQVSADAGFEADDVLVFVYDVLDSVSRNAAISSDLTATGESFPGVSVEGAPGSPVELSVDPDAPLPVEDRVLVLYEGAGEPVKEGTITAHYASSDWSGSQSMSTWPEVGAQAVRVGQSASILDSLVGVPLGSRVLVVFSPLPEDPDPKASSVVVVLDILTQPSTRTPVSEG